MDLLARYLNALEANGGCISVRPVNSPKSRLGESEIHDVADRLRDAIEYVRAVADSKVTLLN
jgi:hypothetical protein